jgi:hypothetical protein
MNRSTAANNVSGVTNPDASVLPAKYPTPPTSAHEAMSSATQIEMSTPGAGNAPAAVAQLAKAIAEAETSMMDHIAELKFIDVQRDFRTCGASVPATVRISIQMRMPFAILGGQSLLLTTDVTMCYAGK